MPPTPGPDAGAVRAATPGQVMESFAERLNAGDLEGVLALYDPNAVFAVRPARPVRGLAAIRAAHERSLALTPTFTATVTQVLETGEVAMLVNQWRLDGTRPDGQPVHVAGRAVDVLRRNPDGVWRIVIDDPWSGALS
jgi:uncharacterized protein (TIGR02246 family)